MMRIDIPALPPWGRPSLPRTGASAGQPWHSLRANATARSTGHWDCASGGSRWLRLIGTLHLGCSRHNGRLTGLLALLARRRRSKYGEWAGDDLGFGWVTTD